MIVAGYVGELKEVKIPEKVSVSSLTPEKLDAAFADLGNMRVEAVSISEAREDNFLATRIAVQTISRLLPLPKAVVGLTSSYSICNNYHYHTTRWKIKNIMYVM